MAMPLTTNVDSPQQLPSPTAHLPLRRASSQRLRSQRQGPRPLFAPQHHQLRGFHPSPVEPLPQLDSVTASSEHAFAGKDERSRRPFRPPLGVQAPSHGYGNSQDHANHSASDQLVDYGRPPSSPLAPPLPPPPPDSPQDPTYRLRSSKSVGDGLRGYRREFSARSHAMPSPPLSGRVTPDSYIAGTDPNNGEVRVSVRSALTAHSSLMNTNSVHTDHSSIWTANSSTSEFVPLYPKYSETEEPRESFDVDDAIGLYEDGFESTRESMDIDIKDAFQEGRPASAQQSQRRPNYMHRRSQSAGLLDRFTQYPDKSLACSNLSVNPDSETDPSVPEKESKSAGQKHVQAQLQTQVQLPIPRDRYGFKKAAQHVTVEQFDAWDRNYSAHVERRRKKWRVLMKAYGLTTEDPIRFPPKSDKVKRYVRKGVPPEWRGAAWFWYAGGPGLLKKHPGLYEDLLQQVEEGKLSDNDREHIERDLNRTFPDNIRFKPDPTSTLDAQAGAGGGKKSRHSTEVEEPIVRALRRVLQTFAVHNPSIGYCQSLNFIAGLLLLFLNEDEEKSFVLLNLVTSIHLPGTHGITLEGANIDIAVLMACIKDALPAIWTKLDDKGGGPALSPAAQVLRLPTVSLATTAWFMSLFVGTLPIESVLRVWDCLFFEGSKTLFRIALAIFKAGERQILAVNDPMEIFQVVQTIPRGMLDVNTLMDVCFKRRGGFGHVSQDLIERRRDERRTDVKSGVANDDSGIRKLKLRFRSKTAKT